MEFEEFERRHLQDLLRFARVVTGEREQAQDSVQNVMLRLFAAPGPPVALDAFAYAKRMVVNDFISSRRRSRRLLPAKWSPGRSAEPDVAVAVSDRMDLQERLKRLPPRQRSCVVLRYYAHLDYQEIAQHLGCSVSTVRSHISRALAELRVDIQEARDHESR